MKALCIGHSHMDAPMYAYILGKEVGKYTEFELAFITLQTLAPVPLSVDPTTGELDSIIADEIEKKLSALGGAPDAVFLWIGGSNQHTLGMINNPIPFDFVLPSEPNLPLIDGAQIVPYVAIKETLREHSQWKLNLLRALAKRFDLPTFQFEAPPPIFSESHLRSYPGPAFQDLVEKYGISPPYLRYKLCRLHAEMYRDFCTELDVKFTPPPPCTLDHGFLAQAAYNTDSIHANTNYYGAAVLDVIADALMRIKDSQTDTAS